MILITGATGQIGTEVTRELSTARVRFRALVRSVGKAQAVRSAGGEAVVGDLTDAPTLRTALEGVERLFLLTPPSPEKASIEASVIDEARRAGVRHVVKLSIVGADASPPIALARPHRESERHIEDSGLAYTFLRPNFFMQNYLQYGATIRTLGVVYAPAGAGRHADIDVRDIAAVAARILAEEGHEGRIYELTGPEAQSFADAAHRISTITGRNVRFVDLSPEEGRKAMVGGGIPEWFADALLELYAWFPRGHGTTNGSAVTLAVEEVLDRPPRSFDQFARENVKTFGG